MHITKFAKGLNKQQKYLKTTGITISDEIKLQFYTKQMIDSGIFNKRDRIDWEDRTKNNKTWPKATKYFQKLVTSKERYVGVVGGTAKKARFESAACTNKHDDNEINNGKKMCVYLDSISTSATASNKQIQEMTLANKAKDDQVVTLLAALLAKDLQVNTLIAKLAAASVGGGSGGGGDDLIKPFPKGWKYSRHTFDYKWPKWKQHQWTNSKFLHTDRK